MRNIDRRRRRRRAKEEYDLARRLDLYGELIKLAGELLTRRLRELVEANRGGVAIMCACRDHSECHRGTVSSFLAQPPFNYRIVHISNSISCTAGKGIRE